MSQCVVLGAGGHAKVVIGLARAAGHEVIAAYDDAPDTWGTEVLGVPVRGGTTEAPKGVPAVIAIGSNRVRKSFARQLHLDWLSIVHPFSWVHESASVGVGSLIFAGSIVQPEATIGDHVVLNTACSVDHECRIGDYAQIGPGAHIGGATRIGEGAFIGIGASVIQGRSIGEWVTIGAGAAVVRDIPTGVVAYGVPARPQG